MYKIKKGILEKNGKKVFAVGQSYYPSFHHAKFPVPPEGDRYGEMKKDLRMMAEMGFNHVRFAALGDVRMNDKGELSISTPFVDDLTREAEKNELSVSIRQQGFAVNLRDHKDVLMIDQYGTPQGTKWSDFIRTTLHHEGVLEDNRIYARELAKHFARFDNMVAYQIYNEPHYPGSTFYDYHPVAIAAYRRWLVEKGVLTEREAASYDPPKSRKEQSPRMWALWRIFARESLTSFLNNASDGSKEGSVLPTYTCFTGAQIMKNNSSHACDFFANAKSMDIVGYTCYLHGLGVDYYPMCMELDTAQCAAELEGKESWCIELDSRTYIPQALYNRSTLAMLGSGGKGLIYYQWRGDAPVPGVPHPNSCGLLNYDGTKTENFENGAKVTAFINRMSDELVNAKRSYDGVGLLHSDYAAFCCDARENSNEQRKETQNSYMLTYTEIYRRLREAGYTVSITDAAHLDANLMGIKVLYTVSYEALSPEEKAAVDCFMEKGGIVVENTFTFWNTLGVGFKVFTKRVKPYEEKQMELTHTVYDIADITGVYPRIECHDPRVGIQLLQGEGCKLLVVTNLSTVKKEISTTIKCHFPLNGARFYTIDGEQPVGISGNELTVERIADGGVLVLREA